MWGEQWICRCGTHNFFVREYCRDCGVPRLVGEIGYESVFEVMANVEKHNNQQSEPEH